MMNCCQTDSPQQKLRKSLFYCLSFDSAQDDRCWDRDDSSKDQNDRCRDRDDSSGRKNKK